MAVANTTPRLGLMLPTDTDPFDPADYDNTFSKLDSAPGFTLIPNYGALPNNLTQAQHGSPYMQLDNGAAWRWNQPSSSAGTWLRINSLGLLSDAGPLSSSNVITSASTAATAPTVAQTTVTAPGGRAIEITGFAACANVSAPSHAYYLGLWVGSSLVREVPGTGTAYIVSNVPPVHYTIDNPAPGSSLVIKLTARCWANSAGGGQVTVAPSATGLIVKEI